MTLLSKPIRRVSNTLSNAGRSLVIEIRPGATDTIFIREAGRRNGYTVPLSKVWQLGARLYADAARAEKAAKKKARKSPMNWSPQQEQALAQVGAWLKDKHAPQVFKLFGYAGTGKTTLTKEIAGMVKSCCFGAFTGKAASVMRRKGCTGASTIHSLIYTIERVIDGKPHFVIARDSQVKFSDLVIIDECSMVDEYIGNDLLSFGKKVLVIGDPAQLPPVRGAGFFMRDPNYTLTEVHRQAAGNPIIALSMAIREGSSVKPQQWDGVSIITRKEVTKETVLNADQVIVGLNRTRQQYNKRMRVLLGREGEPIAEDKLICLKNDQEIGVFNGTMWQAARVIPAEDRDGAYDITVRSLDEETPDKVVTVPSEFFEGTESSLHWSELKGVQQFTYGYAITCHKSQGSQWDNITVFDESGTFREDARRWLYTAVTRASERLTLVLN
jgi:exodeoxyribonuclease-5